MKLTLTKLMVPMAAVAVTLSFAPAAQAREHHYRSHHYRHYHYSYYHYRHRAAAAPRYFDSTAPAYQPWGEHAGSDSSRRTGYGGRPRAWCGWEMRQLVGNDPGPQFNLARNWAHWGHSGPAGVGAVVVWAHHVGKIVGQDNGHWIIQSGNDGNRVRTRPLPINGAIAIRWG
jgi:hypothetical protein